MKEIGRYLLVRLLDWALSWDGFQRILVALVLFALALTLAGLVGCGP